MFKVSDFKIPTAFIKKACLVSDCPFVDLLVVFEDLNDFPTTAFYQDGCIYVGSPEILGDTLTRIVIAYLGSFKMITGSRLLSVDLKELYVYITSFFRFLCFCDDSHIVAKADEAVAKRLYQNAFIWLLMKDIVGPAFGVSPITNFKVIESSASNIDASLFVSEDDIEKYCNIVVDEEEPFIFVNRDIEYKPYLYAHIFIEAINAHGGNPYDIITSVFESFLYDRVSGLAYLAFKDEQQVKDFLSCLATIAGYENVSEKIIFDLGGKSIKTAQMGANPYMNISDTWWFLGLIEQMLEPARGPDWSTKELLKPYTEDVWDKINKEREKRGRAGMTYEALLRFKDGEIDPDDIYILEKTLASDRIW